MDWLDPTEVAAVAGTLLFLIVMPIFLGVWIWRSSQTDDSG